MLPTEVLIKNTEQKINQIYQKFLICEKPNEFFDEEAPGQKLNDYLRFIVYISSTFLGINQFDVVAILSSVTPNDTNISFQFFFLSRILRFFSKLDNKYQFHMETLLAKYAIFVDKCASPTLDRKMVLLSYKEAAQSLSQFIGNQHMFINNVCQWLEKTELSPAFLQFLRFFKWPSTVPSNSINQIATVIIGIMNRTKYNKCFACTAVVHQLLSLKDLNFNKAAMIASLPPPKSDVNKFDIFNKFAIEAINPTAESISELHKDFPIFLSLIDLKENDGDTKGNDTVYPISAFLILMRKFFGEFGEQCIDFVADTIISLSKFGQLEPKQCTKLEDIIRISYKASPDKTIDNLKKYIETGPYSISIMQIFDNFIKENNIDINIFIPDNYQGLSNRIKRFTSFGFKAFNHPVISLVFHFIQVLLKQAESQSAKITKKEADKMIANVIDNEIDPLEQEISSLPFAKIDLLCFYILYNSDFKLRLEAIKMLKSCGNLFETINDDWENYELSDQSFIHQFTTDSGYYIKRLVIDKTITEVEQLIASDDDRLGFLFYMAKKFPKNRPKFAIKIFKNCLKYVQQSPCLITPAISVYCGMLMRKIDKKDARKPEEVFEMLMNLSSLYHQDVYPILLSLKYLNFEFFPQFISMAENAEIDENNITLIEGLTAAGNENISQMTPELINSEFSIVANLIFKKGFSESFDLLSQSLVNLSDQLLNSNTEIPEQFHVILSFSITQYQNMFSPRILKAILKMHTVIVKFMEVVDGDQEITEKRDTFSNFTNCIVQCLSITNDESSHIIKDYLLEILHRFPDKISMILHRTYRFVPSFVASTIIGMPSFSDPVLAVFCASLSPFIPTTLNPSSADSEMEKSDAQLYEAFCIKTFGFPPEQLPEKKPELATRIVELTASFINEKSYEELQMHLPDVIRQWTPACKGEILTKVINLAIQLSHTFLLSSSSLERLWDDLLKDSNFAQQVFVQLILKESERELIAYIYQKLDKRIRIDVDKRTETLFNENFITWLTEEKIGCLTTLYSVFCQSQKWNHCNALITSIFLQLQDSILSFEAINYVHYSNQLPGCDTLSDYSKIVSIVSLLPVTELDPTVDLLLKFLSQATTPNIFRYLFIFLIAFSQALIEKYGENERTKVRHFLSGAILAVATAVGCDKDAFGLFLGETLKVAASLVSKKLLSKQMALELTKLALNCVDIDSQSLNEGFVQFLVEVFQNDYLAEFDRSLRAQIVKLAFHGDIYYTKLATMLHAFSSIYTIKTHKSRNPSGIGLEKEKKHGEKELKGKEEKHKHKHSHRHIEQGEISAERKDELNDEVAEFWIAVSSGAKLPKLNNVIYESMKRAIVFGGAVAVQKIGQMFGENSIHDENAKEFMKFLLTSREVEPFAVISLVSLIESLVGKVEPSTTTNVEFFRKSVEDIKNIFSKQYKENEVEKNGKIKPSENEDDSETDE